jgi:hypothetical protein
VAADVEVGEVYSGAQPHLSYPGGIQPGGASSKPENSNAGATVQPTSVQAPNERADCHTPLGTVACNASPVAISGPSRWDWGVSDVKAPGTD